MKADTNDLATIFGKDVRYVVPLYQRPYVWKRAEHWEPLWDDVRWVLQRSSESTPSGKPSPHFLGAVVLEQPRVQLGEVEIRTVIDGQQRLTTLQIFIVAASRVAKEVGADTESRILERLTVNNEDLAKTEEQRFKVYPTNANRAAFVDVMLADAGANDTSNRIHEAYGFFLEVLRAWSIQQEDAQKAFEALAAVIRKLLKLVVIDLEEEDDAQVIFESLNARGTPSNREWTTKKSALNKHSVLLLNSRIVADHPDSWDEECIAARTRGLAEDVVRLWPGPGVPLAGWQQVAGAAAPERAGPVDG